VNIYNDENGDDDDEILAKYGDDSLYLYMLYMYNVSIAMFICI